MPVLGIDLAGDDRAPVSILEYFEQVTTFGVGDGRDREVVNDQDIDACDPCEHSLVGAIRSRELEFVEEARCAAVERTVALSACLMRECAGVMPEIRIA